MQASPLPNEARPRAAPGGSASAPSGVPRPWGPEVRPVARTSHGFHRAPARKDRPGKSRPEDPPFALLRPRRYALRPMTARDHEPLPAPAWKSSCAPTPSCSTAAYCAKPPGLRRRWAPAPRRSRRPSIPRLPACRHETSPSSLPPTALPRSGSRPPRRRRRGRRPTSSTERRPRGPRPAPRGLQPARRSAPCSATSPAAPGLYKGAQVSRARDGLDPRSRSGGKGSSATATGRSPGRSRRNPDRTA